jgi:nitronate monooxygenase
MNPSDELISTTRRAWSATARNDADPSAMTREEYGALLNQLLEAERAGAKLLAAYLDELPLDSERWKAIRAVQRDEARNCAVLIHLLLEADMAPGSKLGDFYGRGLALRGWRERLEFLNRGQAWVARRIAAALPRVPNSARRMLQAMHESHLANIRGCERLL